MKSWKQNSNIFIQENGFESVVCETAAILSRPQYIKTMVVGLPYIATALLLSYVEPLTGLAGKRIPASLS